MKTIIKYISICLTIVGVFSCSLDRYPLDAPSDQTFLATENELEMALTGCYNQLYFGTEAAYNITLYPIMDVYTDIAWERAVASVQQLGSGIADPDNTQSLAIWTQAYKAIGRSNFLLTNMSRAKDVTNPDVYNRIAAEARFLRAYWYMLLTELYGDVPLILEPQTLTEAEVARTPKSQVVDQILQDLTESEILPAEVSVKGRISKGAVLALKAKIALYNERWEVAADAAEKCMKLGVYQLDKNYEDLFTNPGQAASKEIIFSLQLDKTVWYHNIALGCNSRMTRGYSSKVPTQAMVDSYECTDGLSIDKSPLYDPLKPFDNRDSRLKVTILVPGEVYGGYQFETHRDSIKCWNYNTNPATRVDNQDALNAYASFTGYIWKKYTYMEDADALNRSTVSFIMLRYAEVLLMYAESKIEANQIDNSVYDAINQVRTRAQMPALKQGLSQAELRSAVRKERKYELALEGHRLFDIRRWKIAEKVMPGELLGRIPKGLLSNAPAIDQWGTPDYRNVSNKSEMRVIENRLFDPARDYLYPIPRIEMETNKALVQNPNY